LGGAATVFSTDKINFSGNDSSIIDKAADVVRNSWNLAKTPKYRNVDKHDAKKLDIDKKTTSESFYDYLQNKIKERESSENKYNAGNINDFHEFFQNRKAETYNKKVEISSYELKLGFKNYDKQFSSSQHKAANSNHIESKDKILKEEKIQKILKAMLDIELIEQNFEKWKKERIEAISKEDKDHKHSLKEQAETECREKYQQATCVAGGPDSKKVNEKIEIHYTPGFCDPYNFQGACPNVANKVVTSYWECIVSCDDIIEKYQSKIQNSQVQKINE
jgi:hypothetical protein